MNRTCIECDKPAKARHLRCSKHSRARQSPESIERERQRTRQWRIDNPTTPRAIQYQRNYGVTIAWYDEQFAKQGGRCGICGRNDPGSSRVKHFSIDHDHASGEPRGLLCFPCNAAIGYLQDSYLLAEAVAIYLKSHKGE